MENMMLLIYQDFITENLTVRFTIPVFSVIFKNSAAITNTRPRKMTATPRKMTAATHLMFAKDLRGGLRSSQGPRGPPPTPILEKTLVSRNDF